MADGLGTPPAAATPTVGVVSDEDHRLALAGLIAPQTSTLAVRTGVMWAPGSTAIITGTSATGTMTVNVAAFHAVTTRATADGVYWGPTNEASRTVNISAAPGANSRIDVVYVKQNDTASPVSADTGTTQELYAVATGTAAVSPTKPAIPTGAIELGTVTVAVGATNTLGAGVTIANTARQTAARGAPVPVLDTTDRATLTTFTGLHVIRLDLAGILQRWVTGTTWTSYVSESDYLPYCQAKQDTGQIIPINVWTAVTLDGESLDSDGWHSTTVNNSRITASRACIVRVSGSVPWAASPGTAVGVLGARLTKNGTAIDNGGGYALNEAGELGVASHTASVLVQLATNDYLQLEAFQPFSSSGGGLSTRVAAYSRPQLSVEVIRWL